MIYNINSLTDLSSFYVIYETTIKNEEKGKRGISHFIEHLICNNFKDLLTDFEKNGINWNAYTSDFRLVFYLNGLDEYLNKFKPLFLERLLDINIDDKMVNKEKKIIMEEYTDAFNKQNTSHFLNLYRKLFNSYNPIGEIGDISNIDKKMCENHLNNFYKTPTKIVNVSKNNPFFYDDIKFNKFENNYKIQYLNNNNYLNENKNIFESKTSVIYLSPIINNDLPYINFATSLLGNGLKSPFYQEIREKSGLAYYVNCYLDKLTNNDSIIHISTETSDKNLNILNDKIRNIFENKEKFITKERFDTIKKAYEIHYKKSEINRYTNINKYINPKHWLIEPVLKDITLDKIYDIFDKYFKFEDFYISYDKNEFEN